MSICRRSFGAEICAVTAFSRLSGILLTSLFLWKLGGILGFIWPLVSIYHGFNGICGRLAEFLRLSKGLDGGTVSGILARLAALCAAVFFFLIILYILLYRVRALRACIYMRMRV